MADKIIKGFIGAVDDVDTKEHTIVSKISTEVVDRLGEIVLAAAMKAENYLKNPIVMWAHNYDALPVGKNLWLRPFPKHHPHEIRALTQFDVASPFAADIFRMYSEGWLRGWSIGARNVDSSAPTEEELKAQPEWAGATQIWRSWELLEYSAVPLPANQDALNLAVTKGFISDASIKLLQLPEPEPPKKPDEVLTIPTIKRIIPVVKRLTTSGEIDRELSARLSGRVFLPQ